MGLNYLMVSGNTNFIACDHDELRKISQIRLVFYYCFAIDGLNLVRKCTWNFNCTWEVEQKIPKKTAGLILNDSFLRGNLISALAMNQWNLKGNILFLASLLFNTDVFDNRHFNTTCAVMWLVLHCNSWIIMLYKSVY